MDSIQCDSTALFSGFPHKVTCHGHRRLSEGTRGCLGKETPPQENSMTTLTLLSTDGTFPSATRRVMASGGLEQG